MRVPWLHSVHHFPQELGHWALSHSAKCWIAAWTVLLGGSQKTSSWMVCSANWHTVLWDQPLTPAQVHACYAGICSYTGTTLPEPVQPVTLQKSSSYIAGRTYTNTDWHNKSMISAQHTVRLWNLLKSLSSHIHITRKNAEQIFMTFYTRNLCCNVLSRG